MTTFKREVIERSDFYSQNLSDEGVDEQLACECGSVVFEIYRATYHTFAKCSKCGWVACVHSG